MTDSEAAGRPLPYHKTLIVPGWKTDSGEPVKIDVRQLTATEIAELAEFPCSPWKLYGRV